MTPRYKLLLGTSAALLTALTVLMVAAAKGAPILITTVVELDGSVVTVTFVNNAGRFIQLDDGAFVYTKAGKELQRQPKIMKPVGFRLSAGGSSWSKRLPAGQKRTMSFVLANPPSESFCLKVAANAYGRGGEASLYVEVEGRGCTS